MNASARFSLESFDLETHTNGASLWLKEPQLWDDLLHRSCADSIFLTASWMSAWAETIGREVNLVGVTASKDSRLIGAAVFEESEGILQLAGRGASDYTDLVIDDSLSDASFADLLAQMLTAVRSSVAGFRHFQLNRLRESSRTAKALTGSTETGYFATQTASVGAPQMEMSIVEDRLRKKRFKRRENRLKRAGEVTCETYTRATDVAERLNEFMDLHVKRWAETDTPSKLVVDANRQFYGAITQRLGDDGLLRYTELRLDGHLAGAHYGFLYDGTFTFYKPAYDPELARITPGDVVLKRLLEYARDESANLFDFTIGEEPYKLEFATSVPRVISLHVTNSRVGAITRRARASARRTMLSLMDRTRKSAA